VLLYSMFCQIPFLEIKAAFKNRSFFKALLLGNFVFIPLFVWLLLLLFPGTPVITLGVALVLLTPCIDYVIVFAHLGQANSNAILASTPVLLLVQMICLPLYLDRKSTRLNSSHVKISYAVCCWKKKISADVCGG